MLGHVLGGVKGTYNRHSYDKQRRYWIAKLDTSLEQFAVVSVEHLEDAGNGGRRIMRTVTAP